MFTTKGQHSLFKSSDDLEAPCRAESGPALVHGAPLKMVAAAAIGVMLCTAVYSSMSNTGSASNLESSLMDQPSRYSTINDDEPMEPNALKHSRRRLAASSGYECEEDKRMPATDLRVVDLTGESTKIGNFVSCMNICTKETMCQAIVYNSQRKCFLKTGKVDRVPATGTYTCFKSSSTSAASPPATRFHKYTVGCRKGYHLETLAGAANRNAVACRQDGTSMNWYPPSGCKRMARAPFSIMAESEPESPDPCNLELATPRISYPLTVGSAVFGETDMVSPIVEADLPSAHQSLIAAVVPPSNPDDADASKFWEEFADVLAYAEKDLSATAASTELTVPPVMKAVIAPTRDFMLEDGAQAVRADFPNYWPSLLITRFLDQGARMDPDVIPQRSLDDFVNNHVLLSRMAGWAVSVVSPVAFACKWKYGRARPEEVAWELFQGEDLGAPGDLVGRVKALADAGTSKAAFTAKFTAYASPGNPGKEGSPKHPSFPAMHSAASSASFWLPVVMGLTNDQVSEARALDWAVSRFRTVAGVHYQSDNVEGLKLGQAVVEAELKGFLDDLFGPDEKRDQRLTEKIERVKSGLDWDRYNPLA